MSIQALDWAFRQEIFPSSRKFVLVALCNHPSDTGKTYPSVNTICQITSQKDDTVRNALASLVADGIIVDTGKKTGATQQVKVYQLPPDAWERLPKSGAFKEVGKDPRKTPPKTPERPPQRGSGTVSVSNNRIRKFVKPRFDEMELYAGKIGLPPTEINKFFDYHESKGWVIGRAPMRCWQAAMRTWATNARTFNYGNRNDRNGPKENPRNRGVAKGPTDYAAAFKRKAEAPTQAQVAEPGAPAESDPPATQSLGG